ncbi:MAG: hypothetical protein ABFR90_00025 [Planctomycetota bacterium]
MSDEVKKKISKLAIVSVIFIILGFLALPVCKQIQFVMDRQGLDYTRMGVHLFSTGLWGMALLLALLAVTLISFKQTKDKGLQLPWICCIVSLLLIAAYSVPLPEYKNTVIVDREKTFDGDSSELKNTVIVPALDSPMPKDKNIVWCSSFQLAWNELEDKIIKEPILLSENQNLADLLNQAKQSKQDVAESDYYARAGFVQDNIIESIQTEMSQKFPEEPIPSFDDVTPLTAIISYSFLSANVRFKIPYFENDQELVFTDSSGNKTAITSFGIREEDDYAYYKLRRQMHVLFTEHNSDYQLTECAIDLCKKSSPNQIVLAMVEPKETLLETLSYIDEQIKKSPNDGHFHEFGLNDVLLVPNLFWKIVHSYEELEGRALQNTEYAGMPIEKAMQVIQFRLDRSGAELKSEAKTYASPVPTFYTFNRPFLVYMKKRGAESPFFAMWVDNAELLEKF